MLTVREVTMCMSVIWLALVHFHQAVLLRKAVLANA